MDIFEVQAKLADEYNKVPRGKKGKLSIATGHRCAWMPNVLTDSRRSPKIDTLSQVAKALGYRIELSIGDGWMDLPGMRQKVTDLVRSSNHTMKWIAIRIGYGDNWLSQILQKNKSRVSMMKFETMEMIVGVLGYQIDLRVVEMEDAE